MNLLQGIYCNKDPIVPSAAQLSTVLTSLYCFAVSAIYLFPQCLEAGDSLSYSAGMREAALHAAAGRCPNIVGLTDAFEHRSSSGRHPVMVMEPCGTNLLNVRVTN